MWVGNRMHGRPDIGVIVNSTSDEEHLPKRPPIFITVICIARRMSAWWNESINKIFCFIWFSLQPLKDIAVVRGQSARFECIVQCDPHPYIQWYKNDVMLENDANHIIEFRNGVCRLTIPEAHTSKIVKFIHLKRQKKNMRQFIERFLSISGDAGIYSCTGTNHMASVVTSGELIVPSDNWGVRK